MYTVILSPGDNPIAVNKYIISYKQCVKNWKLRKKNKKKNMRTKSPFPRLQTKNSLIWRSFTNCNTRSGGKYLQNQSYQNLGGKISWKIIDMDKIILKYILNLGCLGTLCRYKCLTMRIRAHVSTTMTSGLPPNGGNFWLAKRRSASEELSSMETMIYVPRNACQFNVCKTVLCILFTG